MTLSEEMSGRQLAEVLSFLSKQVQDGVEKGTDVVSKLRELVDLLEEQDGPG